MVEKQRASAGAYALLIYLPCRDSIEVGRLGLIEFPSGYYLYVGSALGGLKARIARHLRPHKPLRWHIDYLTAHAEVVEIWWQFGREKRECEWVALAGQASGASLPVPGFGCSDCRCASHLVHFTARPSAIILGTGPISTLTLISHQPSAVSGQR